MDDKLIDIPRDDYQNYLFGIISKSLDENIRHYYFELTNHNSIKVHFFN